MRRLFLVEYVKIRNGAMLGSVGACLMAVGDWLIGYIDPASIGNSMILVKGCSEVGYIRPVLSMIAAVLGVILCTHGMLCMTETICGESKLKKLYRHSVMWGAVQWLFIHFAFCGLRYIYQYFWDKGYEDMAFEAVNTASNAFMPVFLLSYIAIIIPYVVYFISLLRKKTIFPRWTAWFYMLTFTLLFKLISVLLGETPIANGFSTASNNMAIAIWLLCVWIYLKKCGNANELQIQ